MKLSKFYKFHSAPRRVTVRTSGIYFINKYVNTRGKWRRACIIHRTGGSVDTATDRDANSIHRDVELS